MIVSYVMDILLLLLSLHGDSPVSPIGLEGGRADNPNPQGPRGPTKLTVLYRVVIGQRS